MKQNISIIHYVFLSHQDVNDISPTVVVEESFTFSENLSSMGLPFDEDRNMYELFTISAEDGDASSEQFGVDRGAIQ